MRIIYICGIEDNDARKLHVSHVRFPPPLDRARPFAPVADRTPHTHIRAVANGHARIYTHTRRRKCRRRFWPDQLPRTARSDRARRVRGTAAAAAAVVPTAAGREQAAARRVPSRRPRTAADAPSPSRSLSDAGPTEYKKLGRLAPVNYYTFFNFFFHSHRVFEYIYT